MDFIHFSHGNGFPAETYHQVIKGLRKNHNVGYISCLGHNEEFAVNNNWANLTHELLDYITKNYKQKIIAVGHSLGGVVSYNACLLRPDLFKAVILLDSPLYSSFKIRCISLFKTLGLIDYFTPARNTKYRRFIWGSYQEAIDYFKTKSAFKNFDQDCLRDYVYFGTEKVLNNNSNKEIKLKFDPMIEWQIYRTISSKIPKKIGVPCALIYGEHSNVVSDKDANLMQRKYDFYIHKLNNCGHLFPFEKPVDTLDAISIFLDNL